MCHYGYIRIKATDLYLTECQHTISLSLELPLSGFSCKKFFLLFQLFVLHIV